MESGIGVNVRGRLLGEYIDDANESTPASTTTALSPGGENVRPRMLGDFVDDAAAEPESIQPVRSFVVLLKEKREIIVHGTQLKFIPAPAGSTDLGSYAVFIQCKEDETCVALFHAPELIGIFESPTANEN